MKKVKTISLILTFAVLTTVLCSCSVPVTYRTEYEGGRGWFSAYSSDPFYCSVKVDYDFHVEYGEVINIWFSMVRNPRSVYSMWMTDDALTIRLPDGEHYDVVSPDVYVIEDYFDDKYEVQESKNEYPINVHFAIKITDPSFDEEKANIEVKFRCNHVDAHDIGGVGLSSCDENGWTVFTAPVIRFVSDDDGVIIYYYTGKNSDYKHRILRSF